MEVESRVGMLRVEGEPMKIFIQSKRDTRWAKLSAGGLQLAVYRMTCLMEAVVVVVAQLACWCKSPKGIWILAI